MERLTRWRSDKSATPAALSSWMHVFTCTFLPPGLGHGWHISRDSKSKQSSRATDSRLARPRWCFAIQTFHTNDSTHGPWRCVFVCDNVEQHSLPLQQPCHLEWIELKFLIRISIIEIRFDRHTYTHIRHTAMSAAASRILHAVFVEWKQWLHWFWFGISLWGQVRFCIFVSTHPHTWHTHIHLGRFFFHRTSGMIIACDK